METSGVITLLRRLSEKYGSQSAAATYLGVSDAYLSDVLAGKREPGGKILTGLGLVRSGTTRRATPATDRLRHDPPPQSRCARPVATQNYHRRAATGHLRG